MEFLGVAPRRPPTFTPSFCRMLWRAAGSGENGSEMQDHLLNWSESHSFSEYYVLLRKPVSIKPSATLSSFCSSDVLTCCGDSFLFFFKDGNPLGLQTRASAENTKMTSHNALKRTEIVKRQKHWQTNNNNKPELTHQMIIGLGSQTCCTYALIAEDAEQGCVVSLKVLP